MLAISVIACGMVPEGWGGLYEVPQRSSLKGPLISFMFLSLSGPLDAIIFPIPILLIKIIGILQHVFHAPLLKRLMIGWHSPIPRCIASSFPSVTACGYQIVTVVVRMPSRVPAASALRWTPPAPAAVVVDDISRWCSVYCGRLCCARHASDTPRANSWEWPF